MVRHFKIIRAKWLLVAIATMFLVVACTPFSVKLECNYPSVDSPAAKSEPLTIEIYVDGTPSMRGYVATSGKSRYSQTLELLDSIFTLAGSLRSESQIKYYRLGTTSVEMTRNDYRKAQETEFYGGSNPKFPELPVSQIETAITPIDEEDKLTVIITDLYQKDTDITKVNQAIKEHYLNPAQKDQGLAVGMLAVRSEFQGEIFTENNDKDQVNYDTAGKPLDQYHPFYVILIGYYSDINYYLEQIESQGGDLNDSSQLLIFSPHHPVGEISTLKKISAELPTDRDIERPFSINNGKVMPDTKNQPIDLLKLHQNEEEEIKIPYDVPLTPLAYSLPIAPDALKTNIKVQHFDSSTKSFQEPPNVDQLATAMTIDNWKVTNNDKLSFNLNLQPTELQPPGVYFLEIEAIAGDLQEPDWWQEWNATSEDISDGSKTYNLLKFLQQLKALKMESMTDKENKPVIGHFCYAIQRN
ncbi:MAG: hypothetical protein F6K31_17605 [Symploca sp. SIO2G7]|nr:hypothetical protein [Symploca sp. SIO2G7]